MRGQQSAWLGLLILGLTCNAIAQNPAEEDLFLSYGDEELISIATGIEQHISKAPAVASVITAKDIKAMGATTLEQVLESVPGLHVSLSSARFTPIYQIRGIATDYNPQVLMLINGVPLTQLYFGDRGTNATVPVSTIERIEIIRGPGSAVNGADAFSGVINVITKSAGRLVENEMGVQAGSFDTRRAWLLYGTSWNEFDFMFSIDAFGIDDDEDRIIDVDLQSIFDLMSPAPDVSLAPGPAATREERVDLRFEISRSDWVARIWHWQQKDLGTGPGIAQALDPIGRSDAESTLLDWSLNKKLRKDLDFSASISYMDISSDTHYLLFPPGTILPIGPDGNLSRTGAPVLFPDGLIGEPAIFEEHLRSDFSVLYSGMQNHVVRFALGTTRAELEATESKNFGPGVIDGTEGVVNGVLTEVTDTPFAYVKEEDRSVYYVSIQDEWSYAPDWVLTAGVRYDKYSDFGSTLNPRLALVWNTKHNLTTKFLYGEAFRAPAFVELFNINNPIILGNEDLNPEEIDMFEIAFDYRPNFNIRLGLNLYVYEVKDLIEFVDNSGGTSATAQNIGQQDGRGFETEFEYDFSKTLHLKANYAFQDSEDKATGRSVANTPARQFYANLMWEFAADWSLSGQINAVMDRKRVPGDPRENIDDYTTFDLALRRENVFGEWGFMLGIRNLADEEVREPSLVDFNLPTGSAVPNDYPLSGRSYIFEGRLSF